MILEMGVHNGAQVPRPPLFSRDLFAQELPAARKQPNRDCTHPMQHTERSHWTLAHIEQDQPGILCTPLPFAESPVLSGFSTRGVGSST